jgi:hypothetical protein
VRLYAWQGPGLFEVAFVDLTDDRLIARGTQLRAGYSLSYVLGTSEMFVSEHLRAEVETVHGAGTLDLHRGTKPLREDVLDLDLQLRRSSTRFPFCATACTKEATRANTPWRS